MTYTALRKRLKKDPSRYQLQGWTVGYLYGRWSDRSVGERAYLIVDDLKLQKTFHALLLPEQGMALGAPDPD
jgi:hypothetical protein